MIKAISVTNFKGETLRMDLFHPEECGLIITDITGIGGGTASINTSEMATGDGSWFNSARIEQRNIVITTRFLQDVETNRHKCYQYFPTKKPLTLEFETDLRTCYIDGYVESNEPQIFSEAEVSQISIICPDPFFYAGEHTADAYSGTISEFEFPFWDDSVQIHDNYILNGDFSDIRNTGAQSSYTDTGSGIQTIDGWTLKMLEGTNATVSIENDHLRLTGTGSSVKMSFSYQVQPLVAGSFSADLTFRSSSPVRFHIDKASDNSVLAETTFTSPNTERSAVEVTAVVPEDKPLLNVVVEFSGAASDWCELYNVSFADPTFYNGNLISNYDFETPIVTEMPSTREWHTPGETINGWFIENIGTTAGNYSVAIAASGILLRMYRSSEHKLVWRQRFTIERSKTYTFSALIGNNVSSKTFITQASGVISVEPIEFVAQGEQVWRMGVRSSGDGVDNTVDFYIETDPNNEALATSWTLAIRAVKLETGSRSTIAKITSDGRVLVNDGVEPDVPGEEEGIFVWGTIEFGRLRIDDRAIIDYPGDADGGMIISIHATGTAENITIYNADTEEKMEIDTDRIAALTGNYIDAGDVIEISTVNGRKYMQLRRGNEVINIIGALGRNSDWLQLTSGTNVFSFTASQGAEHLTVTFSYRQQYLGV